MSRLSPLIVRRAGTAPPQSAGMAFARPTAVAWASAKPFDGAEPAKWLEELKLFATGWIGGLIFFGTYLG